jgi:DNA-binding MarR family transcriptional regulator
MSDDKPPEISWFMKKGNLAGMRELWGVTVDEYSLSVREASVGRYLMEYVIYDYRSSNYGWVDEKRCNIPNIAHWTALSKSTVKRALDDLEARKWISRERHGTPGNPQMISVVPFLRSYELESLLQEIQELDDKRQA